MKIEPCAFEEISENEHAVTFPDFNAPDVRIVGSDEDGWRVVEVISLDGETAPHMDEVFPTAQAAKDAVRAQSEAEGLGG